MNEKQAIDVIREMIHQSRHKYSESAIYFLVWGWCISAAALVFYLNLKLGWNLPAGYIWIPGIGIPFVWAIVSGIKADRKSERTTFVDYSLSGIWFASTGVFLVMMLIGVMHTWVLMYPVLIAFFSWGTIATGVLLKFKPLIIGGIGGFVLAIAAVFVTSLEILLIMVLALIVTYLIPGYMLKRHEQ